MLILKRRIGETIIIGDQVTVAVLGLRGNQVRIGINAPKEVSVDREELRVRKGGKENGSTVHVEHIAGDGGVMTTRVVRTE